MKYIILLYAFTCSFVFASEVDDSLNLSQFSKYSEKTTDNANRAFLAIEEGEFEEASSPLKYAAEKHERYSMTKYAFYLMNKDQLLKSRTPLDDLRRVADLMLMAAYRREEIAEEFVSKVDKLVKKINKKEGDPDQGLMDIMKTILSACRQKWLEGNEGFMNYQSKKKLEYARDLFVFSALPYLDMDCDKISEKIITYFDKKFRDTSMEAPSAEDINSHACDKLKEIDVYASYGGKKAPYYKHKSLYAVSIGARYLNFRASSAIFKDGAKCATPDTAMAAGPVYESLRRGKVGNPLSLGQSFLTDKPYKKMREICSGDSRRSLWFIEATHLDKPWVVVNEHIGSDWPRKFPRDQTKAERIKRIYKEEIDKFVESDEITNSPLLRLYLLSLLEEVNEEEEVTYSDSDEDAEIDTPDAVDHSIPKKKQASSKKRFRKKEKAGSAETTDEVIETDAPNTIPADKEASTRKKRSTKKGKPAIVAAEQEDDI